MEKKNLLSKSSLLLAPAALALAGQACGTAENKQASAQKPNVLIIYTDDMGIGDLSCYNDGWITTPNIDKIGEAGIRFDRYYSSAPVSSPSRSGLTTGRFPLEVGINTYLQTRKGNANCEQNDFLDANLPTMADAFRAGGYATAHIGKWHMGGGRDVDNAPQITEYGFDEYLSTWESPDPAPEITASDWIWCADDSIKRWERTAYFVDKTLDFLKRHKGQPCFVNFWPDDMHTPWVPDKETQDLNKGFDSREKFEPVLREYDKQIGRLMDGLRELGLEENTLVIFTSDNGPAPSFQQIRANALRGVKNSLYEGGINMPFLVRWPAKIKAGGHDATSVICAVDLIPSLCKIAGIHVPAGAKLSGEDMSQALLGKPQTRKGDLMWDFGRSNHFGHPRPYHTSPHLAIRRGDMKLLINGDGTNAQLYDLSKDPNETQDVAAQHEALVKELSAKVLAWWAKRPNQPLAAPQD